MNRTIQEAPPERSASSIGGILRPEQRVAAPTHPWQNAIPAPAFVHFARPPCKPAE
jgi:hypothetical protein